MDNKNSLEERVVQTFNRLNVVNAALLKAESDSDVGLAMLTFAEFVLRACYLLRSDLLLGNLLMKQLC